MPSLEERVKAGAVLLDSRQPGWEKGIDLASLNMQNSCFRILGQVYGQFLTGLYHLHDISRDGGDSWYFSRAYGFDMAFGNSFDKLKDLWVIEINKRKAANGSA